jgi:peptide/nickel transport system substrate-binding protein
VTNSRRVGGTLLAAVAVALVVLLPASARTDVASRYGGTLVFGIASGDPDTLDPTTSIGSGIVIYPAIIERLYQNVRNHGKIELAPVLAAALPVLSKDKLSYTVQLRKGVLFNDGTPFNAQAVVTTVQRFMSFPNSSRATDYASVASVEATGPHTVVFRLKSPDSAFVANPYVLSPTALEKWGESFGAHPVGVGPFMFDSRVAGDHVTVVKSPYYYGRDSVYLDKIVYRPVPNVAAAAAALRSGDMHALNQVDPTQLQAVRQDAGIRVLTAPQLGWRGVIVNIGNTRGAGNPPYSNVGTSLASSAKLRRAFEEAIDRTTMNRVVFSSLFQTSCTPIAPANTTWYPALKVPCTPYDPANAKRLVATSGISNPTVRLLTSNSTDNLRLAQFIQEQEKAVGINVVIESTDLATALARQRSGDFDAAIGGLVPGSVEPSVLIHQFFATRGVRNYSGYSNPRMDYVLTNGLKASRIAARAVNYKVVHEILHDERPAIVLYNPITYAGVNARVKGAVLAPNGFLLVEKARFE